MSVIHYAFGASNRLTHKAQDTTTHDELLTLNAYGGAPVRMAGWEPVLARLHVLPFQYGVPLPVRAPGPRFWAGASSLSRRTAKECRSSRKRKCHLSSLVRHRCLGRGASLCLRRPQAI